MVLKDARITSRAKDTKVLRAISGNMSAWPTWKPKPRRLISTHITNMSTINHSRLDKVVADARKASDERGKVTGNGRAGCIRGFAVAVPVSSRTATCAN